jgi:hypothetical protein
MGQPGDPQYVLYVYTSDCECNAIHLDADSCEVGRLILPRSNPGDIMTDHLASYRDIVQVHGLATALEQYAKIRNYCKAWTPYFHRIGIASKSGRKDAGDRSRPLQWSC